MVRGAYNELFEHSSLPAAVCLHSHALAAYTVRARLQRAGRTGRAGPARRRFQFGIFVLLCSPFILARSRLSVILCVDDRLGFDADGDGGCCCCTFSSFFLLFFFFVIVSSENRSFAVQSLAACAIFVVLCTPYLV